MLSDIRDQDAALEDIEQGEELVPSEVIYAIMDGENPIRVWREFKGYTQKRNWQNWLASGSCICRRLKQEKEQGQQKYYRLLQVLLI